MNIIPLAHQHLEKIARLHLEYLKSSFSGKPGIEILKLYYSILLEGIGGCCYVGEENDEVYGYVVGIWAPDKLRKQLILKKFLHLLFWIICQIYVKPSVIKIFYIRIRGGEKSEVMHIYYELRPIVVDPIKRGTSLARNLVYRLVKDAKERNFSDIYLYVDPDNVVAQHFYRKMGFEAISSQTNSRLHQKLYRKVI
jgi:ribosomal protein S18 acetylase RimI-like enzyme